VCIDPRSRNHPTRLYSQHAPRSTVDCSESHLGRSRHARRARGPVPGDQSALSGVRCRSRPIRRPSLSVRTESLDHKGVQQRSDSAGFRIPTCEGRDHCLNSSSNPKTPLAVEIAKSEMRRGLSRTRRPVLGTSGPMVTECIDSPTSEASWLMIVTGKMLE
jgi:hypothetical protein